MKDKLLCRIGNHIVLDIIESWPQEIIQIIEKYRETIHAYLQLEHEIDKQAEEDVLLRVYRPENQFESDWLSIISQIEGILKLNRFVGFHCTKLTDIEIRNIYTYGLMPLSSEMLDQRIDQLRNSNMIDEKTAEELKRNNRSSENNRKGNVFFFHGSKTLKDELGLYRLFRLWGGEALYANHERNPEIFKELFHIGKPCIVLGSLGYDDINSYPSIGTKFITVYLNKDNLKNCSYDFDNWVKKKVEVLSVITADDEIFEQLTGFSTWKLDR